MAPSKTCMEGLSFALCGEFGQGREFDSFKRWITQRGGTMSKSLTSETTHLIVSEIEWAACSQAKIIKDALARPKVKLVKVEWAEKYIRDSKAPGGSKVPDQYDFRKAVDSKVLAKRAKEQKKAEKKAQKEADKEINKAQKQRKKEEKQRQKEQNKPAKKRSRSALVNELDDHTSSRVPPLKRQRANTRPTGLMAELQRFKEGKKTAKHELLSDGYHVFVDNTGFVYNITLTRIQLEFNINQTLYIRFYETDQNPHYYAVTKTLCGSFVEDDKTEWIVGTNTPYATAFRAFKKAFREVTGYEWNERLQFARRRTKPTIADAEGAKDSGFATPALIHAMGGARQTASGKVLTKEKKDDFLREKFSWRAPYPGEPEGVMGPSNVRENTPVDAAFGNNISASTLGSSIAGEAQGIQQQEVTTEASSLEGLAGPSQHVNGILPRQSLGYSGLHALVGEGNDNLTAPHLANTSQGHGRNASLPRGSGNQLVEVYAIGGAPNHSHELHEAPAPAISIVQDYNDDGVASPHAANCNEPGVLENEIDAMADQLLDNEAGAANGTMMESETPGEVEPTGTPVRQASTAHSDMREHRMSEVQQAQSLDEQGDVSAVGDPVGSSRREVSDKAPNKQYQVPAANMVGGIGNGAGDTVREAAE